MASKVHKDLKRDKPKYPNQVLKLTLPIPISVNKMYYNTKHGKILTKAAKQWKAGVMNIADFCVKNQKWKQDNKDVWYVADMDFYMPDRIVRDTHNTFKLLFDSLEGVVFPNDYYVKPRVQGVWYDKHNPRLEMTFYPEPYKEGNYEEPEHIADVVQRQRARSRSKKKS